MIRCMEPDGGGRRVEAERVVARDPLSAMTPRFNFFFRWFANYFFRDIQLDDATVQRLRDLESQGSVIYVMRYASRLDYFLFNTLFVRHGLRLSNFANGFHFDYYQPLWTVLRQRLGSWRWLRRGAGRALRPEQRETVRALVADGESLFLFLRTERLRSWLRGRRHVAQAERSDRDLLREAVGEVWPGGRPLHLVPLALFWRKGPRNERRFLNLAYGAPTRPSDLAKVTSFLLNYRELAVKVGEPIDMAGFVEERRERGLDAVVRMVRRSILIFLYRQEKVVEGPTLRPIHKVQEAVLSSPTLERAIEAQARTRQRSREAARADAESMFREIAAQMNSTFLALLNQVVTPIFRRLFVSVDTSGLEQVAGYARSNPIVLVPNHRSYFDFLLLSWLFYGNHLVPPHIAARENMAFGPFGFVFRRAGAFFLRRSFEDPLYKEVFRAYVAYLVKEGFTQEFFIEGGRSRTGRSLTPKLGMLSWDVEGFLAGSRADLFFVPVGITYERLVEEGAMLDELAGGTKQRESVAGLLRARKVLRRRWGSAHLRFGEPISLAAAIGDRRGRFAAEANADDVAEKRRFIEQFGNRIVERINEVTVASATSVAAAAFLGAARRGLLRHELVRSMQQVIDLLTLQGVQLTPALERDRGEFDDSISFLLRNDLIRRADDPRGDVLYFEEGKRGLLDIYRNAIAHFLARPSFLARRLLVGGSRDELAADLGFWNEFFYHEFFTPTCDGSDPVLQPLLDHFERIEVVERRDDYYRAAEKGHDYLGALAAQTVGLIEAYAAAFQSVLVHEELGTTKQLVRRITEAFARNELLGQVESSEASNRTTFANALDALVRRGVLVRQHTKNAREASFQRGPAFDELPGLCDRLAGVLGDR